MELLLAIFTAGVLFVIASIHFYWAFGGQKWLDLTIPHEKGQPLFHVDPMGAVFIGLMLLLFALILTEKAGLSLFLPKEPRWIYNYGPFIIAFILLLRATGDYKYMGFFKTVKGTVFAHYDTMIYSPLALSLAILTLIIAIL